jgi:hypothetical protein
MGGTKHQAGDAVDVRGQCGHLLIIEAVSFHQSGSDVFPTEDNAIYTLRCLTCTNLYVWRSHERMPRLVSGEPT